MGKKLLTTAAIRRIINLRSDENYNHTFAEIAVEIHNEFGIEVSMDVIRKAYYKHKDTLPAQPAQVKPKSKLAELVEQRKAEKSAPQTTSQSAPKPVQKPPTKRVYQEPDMDKLTRMLHMSDDEFREMMRQEAEEQAKQKLEN